MDYCGPRGIPFSEFLAWSDYDRAAAINWMLDQGIRCSQCGTYPDEWINPDTLIPYDPPPYMVRAEICIGCQSLDDERKRLPDGSAGQHRLYFAKFDRETLLAEMLRMEEVAAAQQPEE